MYMYKESGDRELNQLTTGYWIDPDGEVIPNLEKTLEGYKKKLRMKMT